jgi:hypothetical protein
MAQSVVGGRRVIGNVTALMQPRRAGDVTIGSGRRLATPVHWYRHSDTGRVLVLILNTHMGSAGYWTTMLKRISEMEERGAQICFEAVRPAPEAAWAGASDDERAAQKVLAFLFWDLQTATARCLGWVHQGDRVDGLRLRSTWRNLDLTDLEVIRLTGPAAILAMGLGVEQELAKLGRHRDAYNAAISPLAWRRLARPQSWLSRAAARFAPVANAEVNEVLLPQRSKLAVADIDQDRDTVLIYGANHADSIDDALTAAGWMRTGDTRWLVVGTLPSAARSLAEVARVAGGVLVDSFRATWASIDAGRSLSGDAGGGATMSGHDLAAAESLLLVRRSHRGHRGRTPDAGECWLRDRGDDLG